MDSLDVLVERYGNLKTEMDSYKKQVDADNADIKTTLVKMGLNEYSAGGYTVKYSVAVSEGFDEEKLLAKIDEMKLPEELGIIKMKPYVDMTALENAIYNGKLNAAELSSCKTKKETPRLTIKKNKEA